MEEFCTYHGLQVEGLCAYDEEMSLHAGEPVLAPQSRAAHRD